MRYVPIREVVKEVEAPPHTLRLWCELFHVKLYRPRPGGTHYFTREAIDTLKTVLVLREDLGLTLAGVYLRFYGRWPKWPKWYQTLGKKPSRKKRKRCRVT